MKNRFFFILIILFCFIHPVCAQNSEYATVDRLTPFILKWEGGYTIFPKTSGGATNMGVTLSTWKNVGYDKNGDNIIDITDLHLLTESDVVNYVLKPYFWDWCHADQIQSQKVANIIVDWVWLSGIKGIKNSQRIIGVTPDGIIGIKTLVAINEHNPDELFEELFQARILFIEDLCRKKPGNLKFRRGWLNRLEDLKHQFYN